MKSGCLFSIVLIISSVTSVVAQQPGDFYYQEIKTEISLPAKAGKNVIRLFQLNNGIVAVTDNGIYRKVNDKWNGEPIGLGWKTACLDEKGKIWLASNSTIQNEDEIGISLPETALKDTILSLFWEENNLYVGTTNGLLLYNGEWSPVTETTGKQVRSVVKGRGNELWLATSDGLLRRTGGKWINLDDFVMSGGNKRTYIHLGTKNNGEDIIYSNQYSIACIAGDGNHRVYRGTDGLPYGPVTSIRTLGETLWLGTDRGVIKKDSTWHYYNGKRWLPDNQINDILPVDEHCAWIATSQGISQIQEIKMTLEQKAEYFEERIQKRHIRHGLVSRSNLEISGDLSTSKPAMTHNEGLWTSIYLAAECFRYAVTKDTVAKQNAVKAFEGMERLELVTGIPGFPARTIAAADEEITTKGEWHTSPDGKWKWLGDTSSDEMVGHFFAYPVFYDLVADEKYKKRVEKLVGRMTNHIIDNDFQLVDLDGKPTKWGIWNPDSLNLSVHWSIEHGLNSLQILSFLKAGYYITQDQKYEKACQSLIKDHGYAENMVYQKLYGPFETNFVDNQLSFLPYYVMAKYSNDPVLYPYFEKSINRSWNIIKNDRIAMWNIIASAALDKDCGLQAALNDLHLTPMDMITWNMENSHRWDLQEDIFTDRMDKKQATTPISPAERGITKWNLNVYQMDWTKNGMEENDGAYFLLAYWMGRYHGFFK